MTEETNKVEEEVENGEQIDFEPVKLDEYRAAPKKRSLLDTCYPTSSGEPKSN